MFMRVSATIFVLLTAASLAVLACGGGDDAPSATDQPQNAATQPSGASTQPTASTQPGPAVTVVQGGAAVAEACGLLTQQDAATALGEAVRAPVATTLGTQQLGPGLTASISACNFDSTTMTRSVSLNLWRFPGGGGSQLRQAFEQFLCMQKERVSGLGDVACWYDPSHKELQVLKGTTFVDLQITEASGPDRTQALRDLANKVLARIP